jgi:hypothetical protein
MRDEASLWTPRLHKPVRTGPHTIPATVRAPERPIVRNKANWATQSRRANPMSMRAEQSQFGSSEAGRPARKCCLEQQLRGHPGGRAFVERQSQIWEGSDAPLKKISRKGLNYTREIWIISLFLLVY